MVFLPQNSEIDPLDTCVVLIGTHFSCMSSASRIVNGAVPPPLTVFVRGITDFDLCCTLAMSMRPLLP